MKEQISVDPMENAVDISIQNQSRSLGQGPKSELIFLGSGSSTGVPTPSCVICPTEPPCSVCHKAISLPPEKNRNYRCNPSIMIKYTNSNSNSSSKYIQIDCGKCFKEQVLRWFVKYKIPCINALILTHEHADAMLGLDDIRGIQPYHPSNQIPPLPVYLSQHSLDSISEKFPYLVGKDDCTAVKEVRRVTQLQFHVIKQNLIEKFDVEGLEFTPLPVFHGEDYICLGFLFGKRQKIAYISDVSRIPEEVENVFSIHGNGPIDLLIIDSLFKVKPHNTHISMQQSLEIILRTRPTNALLIGMTHEFDHDVVNEDLNQWSIKHGIGVQLSYDGLCILVDL